jgi:predicted transposase/invertase (TIGR01784 family)
MRELCEPVYLIGLMDMEIPHPDKDFWKDRYISEYTFREKESHDLLDETIIIIFAELTKFRKSIKECETDTDKMLYVLKNMGNLQNRPAELQAEVYRRLFEACEISAFSKDKHAKYQEDMFDEKRLKGIEDANRRIGREEGRAEIVRKMHSSGMSIEQLCAILEMPEQDVERILGADELRSAKQSIQQL